LVLADQQAIAPKLLLNSGFGESLWLWQPVSALFLFPEGQLGGLLLTLIVQWMIAGPLEQRWGTRRYVVFVLACALAGTLATALLGLLVPAIAGVSIGGSTPIDLATLMAFSVVFARQPLQMFGRLPITGRSVGILAAVLALVAPLVRGAPWPSVLPAAVTMLVAFLAAAKPWREGGMSGKLTSRTKGRNGRNRPKARKNRKKSHLHVVDKDDPLIH
jgi:membrane associated rhomboid family serine protease